MPYEMKEVPQGYYVETKATGRRHSKKPLPKARAEAQMRALYASEYKNRPTRQSTAQQETRKMMR